MMLRNMLSGRAEERGRFKAWPRGRQGRAAMFSVMLVIAFCALNGAAQVNSWVSPGSGGWQELQWSLGALPASGQSVMITNAGTKTIVIDADTATNHPASLSLQSLTIETPVGSSNTLLLTNAGLQQPLTVQSLRIGSNSSVRVSGSAIALNGPTGVGMSIGGQFQQGTGSRVAGTQLDVGWIGPGVYELAGGLLQVGHVWLGGPHRGVMNQFGGTNGAGIVHLESGGVYTLSGGDFSAEVYSADSSRFQQQGGTVLTGLRMWRGSYHLDGGSVYGELVIPVSDGFAIANGSAFMVQSGGTNYAGMNIGSYGPGAYTLSNGVASVQSLRVGERNGLVRQWGGIVKVAGALRVIAGYTDRLVLGHGSYLLLGGRLMSDAFHLGGHYVQNGGTNLVAGEFACHGALADVRLSGGLLCSAGTSVGVPWESGGFVQSGGVQVITNTLSLTGKAPFWEGFVLNGGELVVSNIVINDAVFTKSGSAILSHSGVLAMQSGQLHLGQGAHPFGALSLQTGSNSIIALPASDSCVLRFRDSSGVAWDGVMIIENWAGSVSGGGLHQVVFGSNAAGLTANQLSRIFFHDPPGLPAGLYGSAILASGEIVPNTLPPTGRTPPRLTLARQPDGSMVLTVQGDPGSNYAIEVSEDSIDWALWTNQVNVSGTMSLVDSTAGDQAQRFYRAVLLP